MSRLTRHPRGPRGARARGRLLARVPGRRGLRRRRRLAEEGRPCRLALLGRPAGPAAEQIQLWQRQGRAAGRRAAEADRGRTRRAVACRRDRPGAGGPLRDLVRGRARGERRCSCRTTSRTATAASYSAGRRRRRRRLPGVDRRVRGGHRRPPGHGDPGAGRGRRTSWTGAPPGEYHEERYDLLNEADRPAQGACRTPRSTWTRATRLDQDPAETGRAAASGPASPRPTASRSTSPTSRRPRTPSRTASSSPRRSAASTSSSTPAATATARLAGRPELVQPAGPRPRRAARPRRPATRRSTPTCGSSGPASRTARARAARRRAVVAGVRPGAWPTARQ